MVIHDSLARTHVRRIYVRVPIRRMPVVVINADWRSIIIIWLIVDHVVASLILGLDHLVHWISLLQAMSSALSSKVSFIDKISDHFDISLFVCYLFYLSILVDVVTKAMVSISVDPLKWEATNSHRAQFEWDLSPPCRSYLGRRWRSFMKYIFSKFLIECRHYWIDDS